MLLIVTNKTDLACDYLILRLKERGIAFTRLNTEDFGIRFDLEVTLSASSSDFLLTKSDGETISNSSVSAVYFRQPIAPSVPDTVAYADRPFVCRELKEALRSLWRLIDRDIWLNHPCDLWLASNKIEQLSIARSLGFLIPETCVTMTESRVRAFHRVHGGRVVCKAVKHGFTRRENIVTVATTKRIAQQFLSGFDDYAPVPMIYQREISKLFDVRVTVVGEQVFATAIYSQDHPETEVDWRLWDVGAFDLKHEAIQLPDPIARRCRAITHHFGLKYSAIDLVKGTDNEFYFLELNPNGQWAWIEQKVGYPIRDSIIDCLNEREWLHA